MPSVTSKQYTPTEDLWQHYQLAYNYLNETLFDNRLPQCILNFSTHGRSKGFFAHGRWERGAGEAKNIAHEISLNPTLLDESTETILSWLARLMTHLWQWELGDYRPQQQGYYNREFTEKMEAIGLPVSHDGTPEGKKSGFRMRHWIEPDGKFKAVLDAMPEDYFPWKGNRPPKPPTSKTIYKYECAICGAGIMATRPIVATCNTKACDAPFELKGDT